MGVVSGWIAKNNYLSYNEMQNNAQIVYSFFKSMGWSTNAICGMLGNMQEESNINPGLYQWRRVPKDGEAVTWGFGLTQWTPASTKIIAYANSIGKPIYDGATQCMRIQIEKNSTNDRYDLSSFMQWGGPRLPLAYDESRQQYYCTYTFADFSVSNKSPYELAKDFMLLYERPADQTASAQDKRGKMAEYWYQYLVGHSSSAPYEPIPIPIPSLPPAYIYHTQLDNQHRLPIYMLTSRKKAQYRGD